MTLNDTITFHLNGYIPTGHRIFVVYRIYSMLNGIPTFTGSYSVRRSASSAPKPILTKGLLEGSIRDEKGKGTSTSKKIFSG